MGKIAVTFKVMPDSPERDLEEIQDAIREIVDVEDIGIEEVAFGLKAVKVAVMFPDEGGVMDEAQEGIEDIDGVQSVEVDFMEKL